MEVKRPFFVAILAIIIVGLALSGLNDTRIAVANTNVPNDEVTSSASNSSASATITIMMYAVADK